MAAIDAARLRDLDRLLGTTFGPRGRAVLGRDADGRMAITRGGLGVLRAVYGGGDTPFMKTLVGCAETVGEALGDGVKSFVFTTAALLTAFERSTGKSGICRQLDELRSRLSRLSVEGGWKCKSAGECMFFNVITTFFNTRFPDSVSLFLSGFCHEWISLSLACVCAGDRSKISSLYEDFSSLCSYEDSGSRSVTDSCTKAGFLIKGRVFNVLKSGPRKLIIATFGDVDAEDGRFDALDIKCVVNRLLSDLKRERSQDEVLLLSSQILSDLTLFNLGRSGVGVVHGVRSDEINFLYGKLAANFKGGCNFTVNVGLGEGHVLIGMPAIRQMFVCGPTKELRLEYALACRSVVRLLAAMNKSALSKSFTKGGGNFERTLHRIVSVKFDKFKNSVPRFSSRAELLNWHRMKMSRGTEESDELDAAFTEISDAFSCLDREVLDSVLEGILAVPCKLAGNDEVPMNIVEPVSLRVGILIHALAAVIALLRCDGVIFSKKTCL